jgi:hypothetical protein
VKGGEVTFSMWVIGIMVDALEVTFVIVNRTYVIILVRCFFEKTLVRMLPVWNKNYVLGSCLVYIVCGYSHF